MPNTDRSFRFWSFNVSSRFAPRGADTVVFYDLPPSGYTVKEILGFLDPPNIPKRALL